jgi:hypothetical protein
MGSLTGALIAQGGVETPGSMKFTTAAGQVTVPTSVQQDSSQHPTLIVEHLSASNSVAALKVLNDSMTGQGMGGYFRAPRAIVARGKPPSAAVRFSKAKS